MNAPVVERIPKAMDVLFGKTYELSMVKGYVSRWTAPQAIRELIQNALDSESPFTYEFSADGDGKATLRLNSEHTVLTPKSLLLGSTSKRDDEDAIGSHGEGYKLAMLVLTREGYDLEVRNGDMVWRPRFRYSRTFGDDILVVDEALAVDKTNRGLTFLLRGLTAEDVAAITDSCLLMQDNVGQVKRTEVGDILLDRPGKLYVGHLYVCDTELKFGYNIKPKHLRLERDRKTVDGFDLKYVAWQAWGLTGEVDRIALMIADNYPDMAYAEYGATELVKEECYRLFRERNPGAVVASSHAEMKQLVEKGMTKVVVVGGGYYHAVSTAPSYRRAAFERRPPEPAELMQAFFSAHRGDMRTKAIVAFKELLAASKKWTLK